VSAAASQADKAARFLELHRPGEPLLMPNAWDVGSARVLASLGFKALATTSSGFAATLGRLDYGVTRSEAIEHGAELSAAVEIPVSADLENCFADDPEGVAETIRLAVETGLAGGSVEDSTGNADEPIYPFSLSVERVAAAAAAAAAAASEGSVRFVLTARCENFLHGRADLADTVARLQAYADAGADVLFAPGVRDAGEIRALVAAVDKPVSVLVGRGSPPVSELASIGVARVSVGGSFAFAALGSLVEAASELRDLGTYGYAERVVVGARAAREAFTS
jgi:2-methylisocitrate lyase-like PEP mutase family enzyme